jgi:hypothetical protein
MHAQLAAEAAKREVVLDKEDAEKAKRKAVCFFLLSFFFLSSFFLSFFFLRLSSVLIHAACCRDHGPSQGW